MRRPKIVLDTNVFLVSLSPHHKYHWVFQAIIDGTIDICVSTEILLEYQEIISERFGLEKTDSILDFLLLLPNVHPIIPFFQYPLIKADPSDDKFIACALMADADYIISNDKHFKILREIDFPPVQILTYQEFEELYKSQVG